jgi:hypothetical protein
VPVQDAEQDLQVDAEGVQGRPSSSTSNSSIDRAMRSGS